MYYAYLHLPPAGIITTVIIILYTMQLLYRCSRDENGNRFYKVEKPKQYHLLGTQIEMMSLNNAVLIKNHNYTHLRDCVGSLERERIKI